VEESIQHERQHLMRDISANDVPFLFVMNMLTAISDQRSIGKSPIIITSKLGDCDAVRIVSDACVCPIYWDEATPSGAIVVSSKEEFERNPARIADLNTSGWALEGKEEGQDDSQCFER